MKVQDCFEESIDFAGRAQALEHRRTSKMASSAHANVRGNTVLFYEWLAKIDEGHLPVGPPI